jgi:hypothetical protein
MQVLMMVSKRVGDYRRKTHSVESTFASRNTSCFYLAPPPGSRKPGFFARLTRFAKMR